MKLLARIYTWSVFLVPDCYNFCQWSAIPVSKTLMLTIVLQYQTKLIVQQVCRRSYRPLTINFPCQWSGIIILFWHVIALNQSDGSIDQSNGRTAIPCLNKFAIQQSHSHWTQRSNGLNGLNVLIRQNSTGWVNPTGLVDLMAIGSLDHSGLIEPTELLELIEPMGSRSSLDLVGLFDSALWAHWNRLGHWRWLVLRTYCMCERSVQLWRTTIVLYCLVALPTLPSMMIT